jgi:hypothetical protein
LAAKETAIVHRDGERGMSQSYVSLRWATR